MHKTLMGSFISLGYHYGRILYDIRIDRLHGTAQASADQNRYSGEPGNVLDGPLR